MPWSKGWGKGALDTWIANAMGLFYVEFDVSERFNNKKHAVVFQKIKEELEALIEAQVKYRLSEIEKLRSGAH